MQGTKTDRQRRQSLECYCSHHTASSSCSFGAVALPGPQLPPLLQRAHARAPCCAGACCRLAARCPAPRPSRARRDRRPPGSAPPSLPRPAPRPAAGARAAAQCACARAAAGVQRPPRCCMLAQACSVGAPPASWHLLSSCAAASHRSQSAPPARAGLAKAVFSATSHAAHACAWCAGARHQPASCRPVGSCLGNVRPAHTVWSTMASNLKQRSFMLKLRRVERGRVYHVFRRRCSAAPRLDSWSGPMP